MNMETNILFMGCFPVMMWLSCRSVIKRRWKGAHFTHLEDIADVKIGSGTQTGVLLREEETYRTADRYRSNPRLGLLD